MFSRGVDGFRQLLDEFAYRATAVIDRILLWRRLPPPVATGYVRSSEYVAVRDGTRIAVDTYRPARQSVPVEGRFPVVWAFERYHRARVEDGRLVTRLDRETWLKLLVRHGYVVSVADLRGSGASFGTREHLVTEFDRWDAYDITEWLAAQPWSNGRVGMFGKSFMGLMQFLAASTAPPHLRAIFPEKTLFDLYSFAYPGGVFRHDYARAWGNNVTALDRTTAAAPVDEDPGGRLLAQAVAEHQHNCDSYDVFSRMPFRDSVPPNGSGRSYADMSPAQYRREIAASGVAIYQLAGWDDMWPRDALLWHANLSNPRKLLIGPWPHTYDSGWKLFPERLRWFDHWLKERPSTTMDGPQVRFHTAGARAGRQWRSAREWPIASTRQSCLYFGDKGALVESPASDQEASDSYVVDYSSTSGQATRWSNGYGRAFRYSDLRANDAKGLSFTTPPLSADLEITGHPVVCVWISTAAADVDLFVYLEEVRSNGYSAYVSEGIQRASHRRETIPPFNNLNLPFHASLGDEVLDLPQRQVVRLAFDLHPVSRVFRRGRRIRVTITGADVDNALTPVLRPAPSVAVHRAARYPSHIMLPTIS
jgi:uncharacterized protein